MLELKASSDMTEWGNWRRKNNRNKTQNCKSVQDTVLTWEQLSSKSLQMFIILKVTATGSFISDISFLSNEHLFFFRHQQFWCFHASKLIRQIALRVPTAPLAAHDFGPMARTTSVIRLGIFTSPCQPSVSVTA